ncbi:SMI1/KNR4 family protein [Myroides odoratimimus]|uniref:SMI1/KNR4 family protein n=1 Tax=Myroides odoratimimus TaxID=76832 RepID=UPI00090F97BD|nr:SMI1/KNR4 family protein [Myroides odoratimimus]SHL56133.1 SMI1-KNR4 cell-wall [Myroides odoratimimus subsp. xuanwuensis]
MEIIEKEKDLTIEDVKKIEDIYKITLPTDFVEFYLSCNGAKTLENWSEGIDLNIPFDGFLSLKYGVKTIEENIELGLQKGMVIFAINAIGTLFFISILSETFGMIYSKRSNSEELRLHCESFSQFLEGLNYIKVKYKLL